MTYQELLEKGHKLRNDIQKHGDLFDREKAAWPSGEDEKKWVDLNAAYDANWDEMQKAKPQADIQARLDLIESQGELQPGKNQGPGREDFSGALDHRQGRSRRGSLSPQNYGPTAMRAIGAWMKGQYGYQLSDGDREASELTGLSPYAPILNLRMPAGADQGINRLYRATAARHHLSRTTDPDGVKIYNAPLTTTDPATGGNLIIPEILLATLEINMLAFGGMREISELMVTSGGELMGWPTANDVTNKGRRIPENTPADDNAGGGTSGDGGPNPAFGKTQWHAYKYTSDTILVPYELLEDSIVSLPPVLGAMLGERIGRITNEEYTTGTGTDMPNGILTAGEDSGITPAGIAIASDDVIALQHAVDPAYRSGAVFMCHDSTVLALRLLKDAQDRYLWADGFQQGVPDRVAGSPIVVNQDMPVVAANAKALLFVQRSRYKIRRVNDIRMYRLQERYRERDQDGFVMFLREDGNLLNAGTNPAKYLTMPAAA